MSEKREAILELTWEMVSLIAISLFGAGVGVFAVYIFVQEVNVLVFIGFIIGYNNTLIANVKKEYGYETRIEKKRRKKKEQWMKSQPKDEKVEKIIEKIYQKVAENPLYREEPDVESDGKYIRLYWDRFLGSPFYFITVHTIGQIIAVAAFFEGINGSFPVLVVILTIMLSSTFFSLRLLYILRRNQEVD